MHKKKVNFAKDSFNKTHLMEKKRKKDKDLLATLRKHSYF